MQTFRDWELILIDDGSRDGTSEVCKSYANKDNRIRYFRFEENSGCPAVRYNDGMKLATSPYFMFMFDDDFWYSHAISALLTAKKREYKDCGMVYGLTDIIDYQNPRSRKMNFGMPWDLKKIREKNLLGNLSVIVPRGTINVVGGYDESKVLRRWCDWDLWQRIGHRFTVCRLPVVIGCSMAKYEDSIGLTVNPSKQEWLEVQKLWDNPFRKVRLMGEL